MRYLRTILVLGLVCAVVFSTGAFAASHEVNYTTSAETNPTNPTFVVKTLKYEPYPVQAGEWFDLWVKVQNTGAEDAKNARFELQSKYPFSVDPVSAVQTQGVILGTANAYRIDQTYDASEAVLKFRVKVADNAPSGESTIQLATSPGGTTSGFVYDLPIIIGKTKTDFDLSMSAADSHGSSFTITNVGEAAANTVIVKIADESEWQAAADAVHTIGNLDIGDSTKITIQNMPQSTTNQVHLTISYTDDAGTRRELTRAVPAIHAANSSATSTFDRSYVKWLFALIGIGVGILLTALSRRIHRTKRK